MRVPVRVDYDAESDAAYVQLASTIPDSGVANTINLGEPPIALDFDSTGRLVGVEVLDASSHLPPELLDGDDH
jgi:uncharacterized protein YuzE